MPSPVTQTPPAPPEAALDHFAMKLAFETDCADVHRALAAGAPDFVLLDVRAADLFRAGHVPGAVNIPHGKLTERRLADFQPDTLFVVYCAGPHCNGADKAAVRLARLGRPVKTMPGGMTGWVDEGLPVAREDETV